MVQLFLTYLSSEKRVSKHTLTAYDKDVNSFIDFIGVENKNDYHEINHHSIRSWIIDLVQSNCSNRTVNRKLSSLRTFFKWMKKNGYIDSNPMAKIKGPKQEKRLPEFIKQEEIEINKLDAIFPDTYFGFRDRLMLEVFYQTGIRLSELIQLKKSDINGLSIKVLGKRNKERIVPITKDLNDKLKKLIDHSETDAPYLFTTNKGNQLYPKFVYRTVKRYLSMLTRLNKRSPHVLRHTFATHMLNNGAGLETLKEVLGHADLSATQVYTHNSFEQIASIYKQAHPRG